MLRPRGPRRVRPLIALLLLAPLAGGCTGGSGDAGDAPGEEAGGSDGAASHDSGSPEPDAEVSPDASVPRDHVVFVSSTVQTADFGGRRGANMRCNALATEAGLEGTFVAWLSGDTTSARQRLDVEPDARFVRPDGARVADSLADLLDGELHVPLNIDESGVAVRGDVWTGTLSDGRAQDGGTCGSFGSASRGRSGLCGSTAATDARWTASQLPACSTSLRVYCFEL